ncbi:MAG: methyltransferase domain-containing protein [Bacteroidia bacterium]|nr:methyltransferase domain-containing protein [Bacteroidia bacterium]
MQQAIFNSIAANYDSSFSNSFIGIMQRNRVWKWLKKDLVRTNLKTVLEINCGTGVDAFWLNEMGYIVTATDISPEMIRCALSKKVNPKSSNPDFMVCGFNDLENRFRDKKFDLLFSNFAGLNCINKEELNNLNNVFNSLLNPNGLMVLVLLGKNSWLEQLYFLLKGDFKKSQRRKRPDLAKLDEQSFQMTYCYSVKETKEIFSHFFCMGSKPIGIAIPPSYFEPIMRRMPFLRFPINLFETLLGRFSFLSNYADHTYLVFRKK